MLRGTREQGHRPPAAAAVPRVRRAGEGGGVDHVGVMLGPQTSNTRLRAVNTQDQKLLALMVKRVGVALRLQRNNGIVRSANGPGQFMLWEIER